VGTTDTQTLYNKTLVGAILDVDPDNPDIPMAGDVDMQGFRVMNLGDPEVETDAVSKKWVEENTQQGVIDSEGSAELAKDWAIKMDDTVDGVDYSSKYHAAQSELSADDSEQSAQDASDALTEFQSIYLGSHATPPATNEPGQLYWNTSSEALYVHSGSEWIAVDSTGHVASFDVDEVVVMSFEAWQSFTDHSGRVLYVVTADPALDPEDAYGTLWLGTLQIGGAGGGQALEGSPPAPINVAWESDDITNAGYRKLVWDDGGMGDAGPAIGYGVLPANEASKQVTVDQGGDQKNTWAIITDTTPGVTYEFEIFAANLAGPGERATTPGREFPGPAAPTNVRSTADAFVLTWDHGGQSQIASDGAVTNYELDQNVNTRIAVTIDVAGKTATLDPKDYNPGQNYKFRVRAESASGVGEWSDEMVREFQTPPAPTNVRVVGTTLMWDYDDIDTGPVTQWEFDQTHPVESSPPDGGTPETVTDGVFGPVTTT